MGVDDDVEMTPSTVATADAIPIQSMPTIEVPDSAALDRMRFEAAQSPRRRRLLLASSDQALRGRVTILVHSMHGVPLKRRQIFALSLTLGKVG